MRSQSPGARSFYALTAWLAACLALVLLAGPAAAVDASLRIEDQEMRFGAATLAGAGGLAPSPVAGHLLSLEATGGGSAPGDWQILPGHRLAPAADGSLDDGDSIELLANGAVVFTVTARTRADHLTVGGPAEGPEWRAAWDAAEVGQTIGRRGESPVEAVPRISIVLPEGRENGGPAPFGLRVEVGGLEGPVAHIERHAEFRWDFGESYPFRRHPDDRRVATDARYARGPWAAHVYARPGRYTVRLTATFGPGRVASAERVIEISDPDRVFHGKHTIVYSGTGDFAGAPPGAQRYKDLGRALAAAAVGRSVRGPRARLLLRAGETTQTAKTLKLPCLYLGRFGEGPNPVLTYPPEGLDGVSLFQLRGRKHDNTGCTFSGIDVIGRYDAADPAAPPDPSIGVNFIRLNVDHAHLTLFDMRVSGMAMMGRKYRSLIIANSEITNWYDYGFLIGQQFAIVGNLIHQHPRARVGPGGKRRNLGKTPNFANHGPVRTSHERNAIISQNYLFSNTGWSKGGVFKFAHQPTIRTGTTSGVRGTSYVGENHLKGGFAVYVSGMAGKPKPTTERSSFIFANNLVEATPATKTLGLFARSDSAIRNNIFEYDGSGWAQHDGWVRAVGLSGEKAARLPNLIGGIFEFYSNTIAMRLPSTSVLTAVIQQRGKAEVMALTNNLVMLRGGKEVKARGPALDARFAPKGPAPAEPGRQAQIDFYGTPRTGQAVRGAVLPAR